MISLWLYDPWQSEIRHFVLKFYTEQTQVLVDRTQHPPFFILFVCIYIAYQSTDAIRKRQLYIHISRLMQSENGILLLFYIFLNHGNKKKKKRKEKGDTVSCPQVPVWKKTFLTCQHKLSENNNLLVHYCSQFPAGVNIFMREIKGTHFFSTKHLLCIHTYTLILVY